MDDAFKAYLSSFVFTLALVAACTGHAADLEYISHEQGKALTEQFENATMGPKEQALLAEKKAWNCSMYGMRTRLQVRHGVKLYEFTADSSNQWKNSGAMMVESYRLDGQGNLSAQNERVLDQVRVTADGKLVSRLTLATIPHTLLSYSVCEAL